MGETEPCAESRKPDRCPACGGTQLWWNGWRVRAATLMRDGVVHYLPELRVRRLRCAGCRHGWTALPDEFVSQRHFQPSVVARAVALRHRGGSLDAVAEALSCSRRSVARWIAWLKTNVLGSGAWRRFAGRVIRLLDEVETGSVVPALAR